MDDPKTYFQSWYKQNGADLNVQRRERYATDEGYRQGVLDRNGASRRRNRQKTLDEQRAKKAARRLKVGGSWKTTTQMVLVDGREVEVTFFTIGALAKVLGRAISTLRVWEGAGRLPATPHRSDKGDRLYTLDQVKEIRARLRREGRVEPSTKMPRKKTPVPIIRPVRYADGTVVLTQLYTIGTLATVLGLTVVWLKTLESKGRLPRTTLTKSALKHRLYTAGMIEWAHQMFVNYSVHLRNNDAVWRELHGAILDGWEGMGVVDALVVEVTDEDQGNAEAANSSGGGAGRSSSGSKRGSS